MAAGSGDREVENAEPGSGVVVEVPAKRKRGRPPETEETLAVQKTTDSSLGVVTTFCGILPGGREEFVRWARAAAPSDERLRNFVARWDELGKGSKRCVSLDKLAEAVGLSSSEMVAMVGAEAMKVSTGLAHFMVTAAQPVVVKASIKAALKRWGFEDRKMLLQAAGIAPVPKGSTTNIQFVAGNAVQPGPRPPDESGLPPFENDALENSRLLHEAECTPGK